MSFREPEKHAELLRLILGEIADDDADRTAAAIYRDLGVRLSAADVAGRSIDELADLIEPGLQRIGELTIVSVFGAIRDIQRRTLGERREKIRWTRLWMHIEADADTDAIGDALTSHVALSLGLPPIPLENVIDKVESVSDTCHELWKRLGGNVTWEELPYEAHFCPTQSMFLDIRSCIDRIAEEAPALKQRIAQDEPMPSSSVRSLFRNDGEVCWLYRDIERRFGVCISRPIDAYSRERARDYNAAMIACLLICALPLPLALLDWEAFTPCFGISFCGAFILWMLLSFGASWADDQRDSLTPSGIVTLRDLVMAIRDARVAQGMTSRPRVRPVVVTRAYREVDPGPPTFWEVVSERSIVELFRAAFGGRPRSKH